MTERMLLESCYRQGQWSWRLQAPTQQINNIQAGFLSQPIPVVNLQGLNPWDARPWTVNLNAWQLGAGGVPPWVITTSPLITPEMQLYSQQAARIRMEWGVDGSSEKVDMDYPAGGLSFQVSAAQLKLSYYQLFDSGGNAAEAAFAPMMSGFIAPTRADQADTLVRPMLTDSVPLPQSAIVQWAKPPRAIAYRFWIANIVAAESTQIAQLSGGATKGLVRQDGVRTNNPLVSSTYYDPASAAQWTPLDPSTQWLQFTQAGGTTGNFARVQWMLNIS